MNARFLFSTVNVTVLIAFFCSLGVANAASVKSLGRSTDAAIDGREAKQVTVLCGNRQERTITKFADEKFWCLNEDERTCHINRSKAAEKACSFRIFTEENTDNVGSAGESQKGAEGEVATDEANVDAKRQSLQNELKEIELERKALREKIDSLEAQKNVLQTRADS